MTTSRSLSPLARSFQVQQSQCQSRRLEIPSRSTRTFHRSQMIVATANNAKVVQPMAVSVGLHKLTGVAFRTSPVVEIEQFDTVLGEATDI